MSLKNFQINNESDLKEWVRAHLDLFRSGNLFLLKGGLGAGKTTLVSYVVEALGGDRKQVSSPTFSLHHIYSAKSLTIDHMDLYRLEDDYGLTSSGFFEVLENREHLSFIEWAERVTEDVYRGSRDKIYWLHLEELEKSARLLSLRPLE